MVGWHQVSQEHNSLPTVIEHHDLVPPGMAVGDYHVHSGEYLSIPIQKFNLPPFRHRHKVFRAVAGEAPLIRITSVLPTSPLHVIAGLREGGDNTTRPVQPSAPATVIEVQVSKNHCMNFFRVQPYPLQTSEQPGRNQSPVFLILFVFLGPDSSVHQDVFPTYLEKQAIQPQRNSVPSVRRHAVLPSSLGHLP